MANKTTIPAPISWPASEYWDGNDGLWNTFTVQVGTPPQVFRVLPSTAGQETWLPDPEGCTVADPNEPGYCGYLRGALPISGANSSGFQNNQSSTWNLIGTYTLDAQEADLGYGGNGLYGFDTVVLGKGGDALNQTKQVAASIADLDYWLGVFGLGPKSINFTTFNEPIENYMSGLVASNSIPSLSWGYTAGASYRNKAPASLTLGGFDTNRFEASNLSISMNADNSRPLQVGVQKIIGENTLGGSAISLLPTATYHFVDSTLPHIWLPDDAIQAFVTNFGLTYDNTTDLFLINDTMRSKLLNLAPKVTFVLGENTTPNVGTTQNIVLPYAAFDLQASYPYYQNATNYFPIRRAANSSQYTIGRTLFQEAYVIADFERNNFTIAQTSFDNTGTQHLVAIEHPTNGSSNSTGTGSKNSPSGLGGGAIAGIVVGTIVALTAIALAIWFFVRRNKQKHSRIRTAETDHEDFPPEKKDPLHSHRGSELPSNENGVHQLGGNGVGELPSPPLGHEMEGDLGKWRAKPGMRELSANPLGHESGLLAEAPGSESPRYELSGDYTAMNAAPRPK